MYNSQEIANRIKTTAKTQNISLKTMLKDCELGINLISHLAKGQALTYINFAKIADYLDCSVDYLLGRTDVPEVNRRAKVISIAEQFENADTAQAAAYGDGTHTVTNNRSIVIDIGRTAAHGGERSELEITEEKSKEIHEIRDKIRKTKNK